MECPVGAQRAALQFVSTAGANRPCAWPPTASAVLKGPYVKPRVQESPPKGSPQSLISYARISGSIGWRSLRVLRLDAPGQLRLRTANGFSQCTAFRVVQREAAWMRVSPVFRKP